VSARVETGSAPDMDRLRAGTTRLRAGALTFCLPWYNPYRFYNEVCMLDHLSRGRLELGVGRGVSPIESKIFAPRSMMSTWPLVSGSKDPG
jgi:hypothetical protein